MKIEFDWKLVALIIATVLLLGMGWHYYSKVDTLKTDIEKKELLIVAMNDSITTVVDENGKLRYTKKTLQAEVKELEELSESLTEEQNKLVAKVKEADKEKKVIAAALIKTKTELENIKGKTGFINDTTLLLSMNTDSISYEIEVTGVALADDSAQHTIKSFVVPNEQTIMFQWGAKKEGYPVSFSVTNSSPYMNVYNIESYAIPQLEKEALKPNFFQKVNGFFNQNRRPFMIGVGVGAGLMFIVTK